MRSLLLAIHARAEPELGDGQAEGICARDEATATRPAGHGERQTGDEDDTGTQDPSDGLVLHTRIARERTERGDTTPSCQSRQWRPGEPRRDGDADERRCGNNRKKRRVQKGHDDEKEDHPDYENMTPDEIMTFLRESVMETRSADVDTCLDLGHMRNASFAERLSTEEKQVFRSVMFLFRRIFGREGRVRAVKGTTLSLAETSGHPRRVPIRRLSGPLREFVRKQVSDLLASGVIAPSRSPWAAAVCLTPKVKKDGTKTWRFAIDYRLLNAATPMDAYVIPPVEEGFDALRGKTYFSVIDMMSAYWSIPMRDDGSREKTAFICHEGLFEWLRSPFGLKNAGATYDRHIRQTCAGLEYRSVLIYRDDCCVFSDSFKQHVKDICVLFARFDATDMTISADKCVFGAKEAEYLGYVADTDGVRPTSRKTSAVDKWQWPDDLKKMRSFLGLTGHFRKFVRNYADVVRHLTELTKKGAKVPSEPNELQKKSFDDIKAALTGPEVMLHHPNYDLPFVVETDASMYGLGAVLLQDTPDGKKVVMYASRTLKDAETRYDRYERECLGVVWALDVFRQYILGTKFKVITDNVAVSYVLKQTTRQHRLIPWQLRLSEFDFEITQRTRTQNQHCDALANYPQAEPGAYGERDVVMGQINTVLVATVGPADTSRGMTGSLLRREQQKDETCAGITKALKTNAAVRDRFFLDNRGILCRQPTENDEGNVRRVVPVSLRHYILQKYHGDGLVGHHGRNRTYDMISRDWWWKGLSTDVRGMVRGCIACRRRKDSRPTKQGISRAIFPTRPMQQWAMDIVVNLPTCEGKRHILTIIDVFTRYAWAVPIADRSAEEVADALFGIIGIHGAPEMLRSDNEQAFNSKMIARLRDVWDIDHIFTRPYHSEANGHVERFHRFLNGLLAIRVAGGKEAWVAGLTPVLFTYNNGTHSSTGFTPYRLFHGRDANIPVTIREPLTECEVPTHSGCAAELAGATRREMRRALENMTRATRGREARLNKERTDTSFAVDDLVMLYEPAMGRGHTKKQMTPWFSGPHPILRRATTRSYVISHTTRHREATVDVKDIRLYHPFAKYDPATPQTDVATPRMRAGDLCIVPLATKGENPFYVARVTRINKKSIVLQWFGNVEDRYDTVVRPGWLDRSSQPYYASRRDCPSDRAYTNVESRTKICEENIDIFGFHLKDGALTPEVLKTISDCPQINWTLE
jgi:transposase InsO family protein